MITVTGNSKQQQCPCGKPWKTIKMLSHGSGRTVTLQPCGHVYVQVWNPRRRKPIWRLKRS